MKTKIKTDSYGARNSLIALLSGNGVKSIKNYNPDFGPDDDGKSFVAGFTVIEVTPEGWDVAEPDESDLSWPKDADKILETFVS